MPPNRLLAGMNQLEPDWLTICRPLQGGDRKPTCVGSQRVEVPLPAPLDAFVRMPVYIPHNAQGVDMRDGNGRIFFFSSRPESELKQLLEVQQQSRN